MDLPVLAHVPSGHDLVHFEGKGVFPPALLTRILLWWRRVRLANRLSHFSELAVVIPRFGVCLLERLIFLYLDFPYFGKAGKGTAFFPSCKVALYP